MSRGGLEARTAGRLTCERRWDGYSTSGKHDGKRSWGTSADPSVEVVDPGQSQAVADFSCKP